MFQIINDPVTLFNILLSIVLILRFKVSDRKTEGSYKRLRHANKDHIIRITGQRGAVKVFDRQLDIERKHGVDVWVWAVCFGVCGDVGHCLSFLWRKQRFNPELNYRLFNWHETERFEVSKAENVNFKVVILDRHVVRQLQVLSRCFKFEIVPRNNE